MLCQEVALAHAHKVVEVVVDKVTLDEEEVVVVQREVRVFQQEQIDYFQVHQCQIRIILDATHAITITSPDNTHMQILNVMYAERRDIYTETVLRKVSFMDNKTKIPRHLT